MECAAILAGGKSSRMGREKALLRIENQPLIARIVAVLQPIFPRICVVTSSAEVARAAHRAPVGDRFESRGPLGGIHAALDHFRAPTFVIACDMPWLCADFIAFLSQNFAGDALVPRSPSGFEPLHAVYAPRCTPIFEETLGANGQMPSMRRVLESIDTRFVPWETALQFDPSGRCFSNCNTPEEWQSETGFHKK